MKGFTPVILIGLIIGTVYFYVIPQYNEIVVLQSEVEAYDEAIETANALDEKLQTLTTKKNSFSTSDKLRLQKMLPSEQNDVRLILDLTNIADERNINLEGLDLSTQNESSRNPQNLQRPNVRNVEREFFNSQQTLRPVGISFSFEATYSEFLELMNDFESSLRIMDVTDVSFSIPESGSDYTFFVRLQTYWVE